MPLTTAQLQTLKSAINAAPDLSALPNTSDGAFEIARLLNLPASPTINAWRTDAPVQAIVDQVDWSRYTPSDAIDNTATQTNRLLSIQTKQMNLQLMLQGRQTVDASRANIRAGIRDAVTSVPSGSSGALVNPGGPNATAVLNTMLRPATRAEVILASGDATTGVVQAKVLTFEGQLSYQDIEAARGA